MALDPARPDAATIAAWVEDAHRGLLQVVDDLRDDQLRVPLSDVLNPLVWEVGHVAWFQERWTLRRNAETSLLAGADALYDSSAVEHDSRWTLDLPARAPTWRYLTAVRDRVLHRLRDEGLDDRERYYNLLAIGHHDMHVEAFTYMRQTLGYPAPPVSCDYTDEDQHAGPLPGDVDIPGGTILLGAPRGARFVQDNEQWEHPVRVEPFRIARAPVTQRQFALFLEAGGYLDRDCWCDEGWNWRTSLGAEYPVYWRREDPAGWSRRHYDRWVSLEPHRPVANVSWFEAEAYCRWAGRRLPTEVEWEAAASADPAAERLGSRKHLYPWGDTPPTSRHANLSSRMPGTLDVAALPEGDSAFGCRQMLGNVWEWTSSTFAPYPGFEPGAYREYSEPWFGTRKVLRGGAWPTRSRLVTNTWRNFFTPDRRDVFAGLRTCPVDR